MNARSRSGAALVTGAGAGIGAAFARHLAQSGWPVYVSDIDADAAASVAASVTSAGGQALPARCDVTDPSSIAAVVKQVADGHGTLGVLVNNAGVFPAATIAETTPALVDAVLGINLIGAINLTMAAYPLLAAAGRSHALFVTAGAAHMASIGSEIGRRYSLYGASKLALERWALGVAADAASDGVRVIVVEPGAVVGTPGTKATGLAPGPLTADDVAQAAVAGLCADGAEPQRLHVARGETLVGAAIWTNDQPKGSR